MQEILNILGSVGFNWHVALANFVNFLIILFLLKVFFFGKIGKTIRERHQAIEHGLNQAKEAEIKLTKAEEEKDVIIKSAYKEKDAIMANAESLARDLQISIEKEAHAEIEARLKKLSQQEATLKETVEKAFGERAPALVAALYAKTLSKEMTQQENDALIASMSA
jgi:F-type H+-transporting ATPase subunit b